MNRELTRTLHTESIYFQRPGGTLPSPSLAVQPPLELFPSPFADSPNGHFLQSPELPPPPEPRRKLFLVPTPIDYEGEEPDSEFIRQPSPLSELPPVNQTVERYVVGLVEIWGGRRSPMQLARSSHRSVYQKLLTLTGDQKSIPRIRKLYLSQPIEGVVEVTVTLRFEGRVRSLALRFEGVEKRWLCTELELI
jgi:hypothetical protein